MRYNIFHLCDGATFLSPPFNKKKGTKCGCLLCAKQLHAHGDKVTNSTVTRAHLWDYARLSKAPCLANCLWNSQHH